MNRHLRRLIGSRRVLTRSECCNNNTPVLVPRNANLGLKCFGSGSLSQANETSQHGKTILQSLSEEKQNKMMDDVNLSDYPLSGDENLDFLDSDQPCLKTLLASPERDYVISNKGDKVDIESLEGKVVALYFYEDTTSWHKSHPTKQLIAAYQELAETNIDFEVVLIYLTDTHDTYKCTNEDTFNNTFQTMPWLALPFNDPVHDKLKRLFHYPHHSDSPRTKPPSIVIIGPHGEYIEPCGAEVLLKFGVSAFPFTRQNLVISETKGVVDLKLEMICRPTTVLKRIDGSSEVQFSHFVGKRVIFYFESAYWSEHEELVTVKDPKYLKTLKEIEFLRMLKERYLHMKGTSYEFEVIYVPCDDFLYNEQAADMSWFVLLVDKLFPGGSPLLTYYGKLFFHYDWSFLLAFDGDGKIVRRTIDPVFKHVEFPFYGGTLEEEAYYKLSWYFFSDGYWNRQYEGLLRNSFS